MDIGGKTLLERHLHRVRTMTLAGVTAVACPDGPDSGPITDLCSRLGVPCLYGPEHDVLERYRLAANALQADIVIRVTSDNPFLDPELLDSLVKMYFEGEVDYAFIGNEGGDGYPYGLNAEVFSIGLLEQVAQLARAPEEREHVMPYVYTRPDEYRLKSLPGGEGSHFRLTVDIAADLERARRLYSELDKKQCFDWRDCIALLRAHPEWASPLVV
jgi:spore coat polysaccharide biosynthesis protein SpsF